MSDSSPGRMKISRTPMASPLAAGRAVTSARPSTRRGLVSAGVLHVGVASHGKVASSPKKKRSAERLNPGQTSPVCCRAGQIAQGPPMKQGTLMLLLCCSATACSDPDPPATSDTGGSGSTGMVQTADTSDDGATESSPADGSSTGDVEPMGPRCRSDGVGVDSMGREWPNDGAVCNGPFVAHNVCDLREMNG